MPGPGYMRMLKRLGPEGFEALRQDTLARQRRAVEELQLEEAATPRDRSSYSDYPPPKIKAEKGGLTSPPDARKRGPRRLQDNSKG